MKSLTNANARDLRHAVTLSQQAHKEGRRAVFVGGGSDVLALMKDRIVTPDVIVNLKTIRGLDGITTSRAGVTIGGLTTLDTLSHDTRIRDGYKVLAEAAGIVATPQIRNVATLAGNVCQRPWCWYYRNGFPCYKAGGTQCFSATGENQFHAIFGGGPSYIVHPSDTAPALVALDATFQINGPTGNRQVSAAEFFVLPRQDAVHENVLRDDEVLASVEVPAPKPGTRSTYYKVMDREAWTHALVSAAVVLEMDGATCRAARVVLGGVAPIPWRLREVEQLLAGQVVTAELAAKAAELAVAGARPLRQNAYKVPMTKGLVRRTLVELAGVGA
jgi:xanthine dehydrogenase YagS FAD-binding subunit